ncbi:SCO family protein [Bremerella sp. JC770]|uniref:SCO family protein n=1 Tax=Bremerella sp. JC770 TaxID=3232137 RepID=UPI003457B309
MKPSTGIFVSAVLLILLGLTMFWAAINRGPSGGSPPVDDHAAEGPAVELNREIPPFQLTSAQEETFDTASLEGDVWIASFFFTACPSICKMQNQQIAILQEDFADQDVKFVSITCDPDNDTPAVLRQYAESFQAKPGVWTFLTGDMQQLKEITEDSFQVAFETQTHSDRLMVVDKNGMLRGTFRATDSTEFMRAKKLLKELLAEPYTPQEKEDPKDEVAAKDEPRKQTMDSFQLTDGLDQPFNSKSLEGDIWLGSFFYTSCPGSCIMQNMEKAKLRNEFKDRGLKLVSITCDPDNDTPAALAGYAERFQADPNRWYFCTGEFDYIQKIGSDFFDIKVEPQYHSDRVFLVGRDGKVIDSFRTSLKEQMETLHETLDEMLPAAKDEAPENETEKKD